MNVSLHHALTRVDWNVREIPSRKRSHIPPWEKETHRLKSALLKGDVSSMKGRYFCVFPEISRIIHPQLTTVDGRNPAPVDKYSLSHYLQGFIHHRWLFGISEASPQLPRGTNPRQSAFFRAAAPHG